MTKMMLMTRIMMHGISFLLRLPNELSLFGIRYHGQSMAREFKIPDRA